MRSHLIVLTEPLINYDLCLPGGRERLGVEGALLQLLRAPAQGDPCFFSNFIAVRLTSS